jgi:CRP-like cAMP-binding protein/sugar phosphate isomerase/epimerase
MNYIDTLAPSKADRTNIKKILDSSLDDTDSFCRESRKLLTAMGLESNTTLLLLAHHKSKKKYGCDLSTKSLSHLLTLAHNHKNEAPIKRLVNSPFFLVKACWLYEHAPYFLFYDEGTSEDLDAYILAFAEQYEANFLKSNVAIDTWEKTKSPKRVMVTTFWESKIFDPLLLLEDAKNNNFEGVELAIDFHPFNYTTLLPEELTKEKRARIKEACLRSGLKLDIHSPIVGPYTPVFDPSKGRQSFFNPTKCLNVQYDVLELAKDIGAGSVVFHLIDTSNLKAMAGLIEKAGGSNVRATIENYCQVKMRQTSDEFIACIDDIFHRLPSEVRKNNFGVTIDVGHLNIEGEDPLVAADRIGSWCLDNQIYFRLHATDNYGNLLFSPPAYSADVHSNVSGRGINNSIIIKLLRSIGHRFDVVAEQIQPLTPDDITTIHEAQTCLIDETYDFYLNQGKEKLSDVEFGALIEPATLKEDAYLFLAGMKDISSLREYLVYRKIQDKKHLSVDEAKRISQCFMRMPEKFKNDLTTFIDDLLLPIQSETGAIQKREHDLICQNISGALYAAINNEHLNQIFSKERVYRQGDIICEKNTPGQEMFFLKEGEVTVYIGGRVASLGPGEIFGEISLFYNINRSATIKASSETAKVGVLSRNGLEHLLRGGQPYAHDLIYRLYSILPDRLRNINDKYKTAIRNLHLIFNGNETELPILDHMQVAFEGKKSQIFPTLCKNDARKIYREFSVFNAGKHIFTEGEQGHGCYYLLEGNVKVVASNPNAKEIVLGELGEGEIFGEMAMIDEKPRSASVVTLTPCKVGFISKKAFNAFIETRSDLAFQLMNFICLSLFRRILRIDSLYSNVKKSITTV